MARIDIQEASVSYFLRKQRHPDGSLERGSVGAQIIVGRRYLEITALKNVSLLLKDGDRLGLVGINGSGKSTLLKLCAGALAAQEGKVTIEGRVSPQFALGSGLQQTLTGRQNTELKCLYMGVPQSAIASYIDEVKELSGLGGYFELPMRSYSAGMRSRLVMSLLRLVRGEILIMDEWINVADPSMNTTVSGLQKQLVERAKILMLASHSQRVLEDWVDKLAWLDQGEIQAIGPVKDVFREYNMWMKNR
ncbi:ATP-binding cassette domain-containing protein [Nitratireductor sp. L1-7-SE]|uniref:ATP-binding cassette domain-containing protein n=1 Tax=Nitratireductor rhodophyticola TaxID=2854036 RepID=A0ABS7R730_9HYPH|nr:ATP-binding cassette domain-containing protein [Nitratireductor rhodophyticola]MBY8916724.1 ATP-binding cassette domain-containing protein [Nitratireductor rhodophyticola]MBY8920847.1 ATP-binding cassette domain-containing protein [Nitratireductor rhodophyticola]